MQPATNKHDRAYGFVIDAAEQPLLLCYPCNTDGTQNTARSYNLTGPQGHQRVHMYKNVPPDQAQITDLCEISSVAFECWAILQTAQKRVGSLKREGLTQPLTGASNGSITPAQCAPGAPFVDCTKGVQRPKVLVQLRTALPAENTACDSLSVACDELRI